VTDGPRDSGPRDGDSEEALFPRLSPPQKIAAIAALLVLGLVFVRFAIPPVSATAARPDGHPPGPCALCHLVTAGTGGSDGR